MCVPLSSLLYETHCYEKFDVFQGEKGGSGFPGAPGLKGVRGERGHRGPAGIKGMTGGEVCRETSKSTLHTNHLYDVA